MLPPTPIVEIDLFIPTIALIGAWKADNEHDRHIIENISGMTNFVPNNYNVLQKIGQRKGTKTCRNKSVIFVRKSLYGFT